MSVDRRTFAVTCPYRLPCMGQRVFLFIEHQARDLSPRGGDGLVPGLENRRIH